MRKLLCLTMRNKTAWSPVVGVIAALFVQGNSSEDLFRDVSGSSELVVAAINELNAYYAESPGFKYAKAISIDTVFLARREQHMEKREHASVLPAAKRHAKHQDGRVLEWEGVFPESGAKIALTRIEGRFHGSYHDKDGFRLIIPYRSGGEWMTMMLVYDSPPPECGTGIQAERNDEEIE